MELNAEFKKAIRKGQYEEAENGLYLPAQKVMVGGAFAHAVRHKGVLSDFEVDPNLVVNQGLDHILDVVYNGATQKANWYLGIFSGNYTPLATDTAQNISTNSTESSAYTEATRPAWTIAAPASQNVTNSASKATFTINGTVTIYGAFLLTDNTKGADAAAGNILSSASRFAASRSLVATDELLVTYSITASDV